jgi:type IX secretion system substrate protein
MKSSFFYLAFLFLIPASRLFAQTCSGDCLANGTFAGGCADTPDGTCDYINPACNAGWFISNGTPQYFANSGYVSTATCPNPVSAFMWSQYQTANGGVVGEGIYTSYPFEAGVTYNVQINFSVDVTNYSSALNPNGYVYLYAANGLTPATSFPCGSVVPTANITKAQIGYYSVNSQQSTQDLTFTFTPAEGTNFNQFWIYPLAVASSDLPYIGLYVSSVFVCPSFTTTTCPSGTVYYNSGTLPQASLYNDIYAGSSVSSGGSGTVTISPTVTTILQGGNAIYLEPQFNATVSGSGSFTATIVSCGVQAASAPTGYDTIRVNGIPVLDSIMRLAPGMQQKDSLQLVGATGSGASRITVYPTIGTGILNVASSADDLSDAVMTVIDESGRVLYKTQNGDSNNIMLDLSSLRSGFYFLQIQKGATLNTRKFIISK